MISSCSASGLIRILRTTVPASFMADQPGLATVRSSSVLLEYLNVFLKHRRVSIVSKHGMEDVLSRRVISKRLLQLEVLCIQE